MPLTSSFLDLQGDICICLNANVAIAAILCRENSREASLKPAPSATSSPRRSRPVPDADAPTPATLKKQKQSSTARFSQERGRGGGRAAVQRRPGYFPDGLQSAEPPVRRRGVELYTRGAAEQRRHRPPAVLQHGALAGWAGRGRLPVGLPRLYRPRMPVALLAAPGLARRGVPRLRRRRRRAWKPAALGKEAAPQGGTRRLGSEPNPWRPPTRQSP